MDEGTDPPLLTKRDLKLAGCRGVLVTLLASLLVFSASVPLLERLLLVTLLGVTTFMVSLVEVVAMRRYLTFVSRVGVAHLSWVGACLGALFVLAQFRYAKTFVQTGSATESLEAGYYVLLQTELADVLLLAVLLLPVALAVFSRLSRWKPLIRTAFVILGGGAIAMLAADAVVGAYMAAYPGAGLIKGEAVRTLMTGVFAVALIVSLVFELSDVLAETLNDESSEG